LSAQHWQFIIPDYHPPAANDWVGRHWGVKHRLRSLLTELLIVYAKLAGVPPATGQRRVRLHLTGWPGLRTLPDLDAFDKLFLDALKQARLIVDDNAAGLAERLVVTLARDAIDCTIVTLEDIADEAPADPEGTSP
jgi:hypothetical protein